MKKCMCIMELDDGSFAVYSLNKEFDHKVSEDILNKSWTPIFTDSVDADLAIEAILSAFRR